MQESEDHEAALSDNDQHICGSCKKTFDDIEEFVGHKRCCKVKKTSGKRKVKDKARDLAKDTTSPQAQQETTTSDLFDEEFEREFERLNKKGQFIPGEVQKGKTSFGSEILYSNFMGDNSKPKFKCEFDGTCEYASYYLKDLERHYRTHTGEKPYVCNVCERTFNRSDKLRLHMRSHTGERPYKCQECTYASVDRSSLVKHIRTHTDERPFKCQICTYASRNSSQLVVHLRTHTGDAPFRCPECFAAFKINSDLKRHLRLHSGEKPFECEHCDYRSAVKGNLKNHIKLNHAEDEYQFNCDICDFIATSRKSLKDHVREHNVKSLKCPTCKYTTSSRSALVNHSRIHSNSKPFECHLCGYSCRQACNLRTHVRKKHPESQLGTTKSKRKNESFGISGSKGNSRAKIRAFCQASFACHLCECSFVREDSLRSHLRHHQDVVSQVVNQDVNDEELPSTTTYTILELQQDGTLQTSEECITEETTVQVSDQEVAMQSEIIMSRPKQDVNSKATGRQLKKILPVAQSSSKVSVTTTMASQQPLRLIATPNASGQVVYQLPQGIRIIPVTSPSNQSISNNNTVFLISEDQNG